MERDAPNNFIFDLTLQVFFPGDIQNCDSESYLNLPVFSLSWYITVKLQLRDYPSCGNSKNLVLVKHFCGRQVKYQLPLYGFFSNTALIVRIVTQL